MSPRRSTPPRASSIIRPASHPACRRGDRRRPVDRRTDPGLAPVARLRRQFEPHPGCARVPSWPTSRMPPPARCAPLSEICRTRAARACRTISTARSGRRPTSPPGRTWPPAVRSSQSLDGQFAEVFAERAQSMEELRAAVDGYLGHAAQSAGRQPRRAGHHRGLVVTDLVGGDRRRNRIAAAGALLRRADAQYAQRAALTRGGGRARPASRVGLGQQPAGLASGHGGGHRST